MTILLDTTGHRLIFANHTGNVPHTHDFSADRIRVDDLIGYLLLTILHRLKMDGYLLVIIADAATHRGDTLGLQTSEKHLLTNAVGLQALTVYVE